MLALLGELAEPVLLDQNRSGNKKRAETDNPLKPEKRRRIEVGDAEPTQHDTRNYPKREEQQNQAKENRARVEITDAFKRPLGSTYLLVITRIERQNGLNILADLITFGLQRWGTRNGC